MISPLFPLNSALSACPQSFLDSCSAFCIVPLLLAHFPITSGPNCSSRQPTLPGTASEALDTALPALESNGHSGKAQVRRSACPREPALRRHLCVLAAVSFRALSSTPTCTIYTPTFHTTHISLMYAAVPFPICIPWCVLRVGHCSYAMYIFRMESWSMCSSLDVSCIKTLYRPMCPTCGCPARSRIDRRAVFTLFLHLTIAGSLPPLKPDCVHHRHCHYHWD
jgi:hypothetical protein